MLVREVQGIQQVSRGLRTDDGGELRHRICFEKMQSSSVPRLLRRICGIVRVLHLGLELKSFMLWLSRGYDPSHDHRVRVMARVRFRVRSRFRSWVV